jgi:hypothetical protein
MFELVESVLEAIALFLISVGQSIRERNYTRTARRKSHKKQTQ